MSKYKLEYLFFLITCGLTARTLIGRVFLLHADHIGLEVPLSS